MDSRERALWLQSQTVAAVTGGRREPRGRPASGALQRRGSHQAEPLDQVSRGRTRELPAPGTDRPQLSRRAGLRRIAAAGVIANEKLHAPILNPSVSRRNEPIGPTSVQGPERWAGAEAREPTHASDFRTRCAADPRSRRLRTRIPGSPPTRARSVARLSDRHHSRGRGPDRRRRVRETRRSHRRCRSGRDSSTRPAHARSPPGSWICGKQQRRLERSFPCVSTLASSCGVGAPALLLPPGCGTAARASQ